MNPIETLQARFAQAQGDYPRLKAEIESRVVCWFWASDTVHVIEPFWFEHHRYPRGRRLKAKPAGADHHEYGVDADGHIVVERQFTLGDERCYEIFDFRQGNEILSYRFSYAQEKFPDNVKRYVFEDDRLQVIYAAFEKGGYWVETFTHEAGRLVRKDALYGFVGKPEKEMRRSIAYSYNAIGQLQSIVENGYTWYRRPERKIGYPKLTALAQERLLAYLKNTIARHAPREPLFALTIAYGDEHMFPPQLGFGTVAEREAWGEGTCIDIWNPAEYTHQLDLETDAQDEALFDLFNQETQMRNRYSAARKALLNCALQLKADVQTLGLQRSADFAIAVTRFDAWGLKKNFKTLYPERPELWQGR